MPCVDLESGSARSTQRSASKQEFHLSLSTSSSLYPEPLLRSVGPPSLYVFPSKQKFHGVPVAR